MAQVVTNGSDMRLRLMPVAIEVQSGANSAKATSIMLKVQVNALTQKPSKETQAYAIATGSEATAWEFKGI